MTTLATMLRTARDWARWALGMEVTTELPFDVFSFASHIEDIQTGDDGARIAYISYNFLLNSGHQRLPVRENLADGTWRIRQDDMWLLSRQIADDEKRIAAASGRWAAAPAPSASPSPPSHPPSPSPYETSYVVVTM